MLMQLDMKQDKLVNVNKSVRLMNELMITTGLSQKDISSLKTSDKIYGGLSAAFTVLVNAVVQIVGKS